MSGGGWRARWQGMSRRERTMMSLGAGTIVLGLVYAIGVEPAWRDRARITEALPLLQSQRFEVEALAARARSARARGVGIDATQALPVVAERSLARAGFPAKVISRPGGGLSVQARGVPGPVLFAWIELFAREARVSVLDARVERATTAGQVDADISFSSGGR